MPNSPRVSRTLNIGVLAHVDAGKTSLTERLLYDAGVIDRLGSVDAGDTQTDTGEIERQRGITVRTAVASLTAGDTQLNLIDTPGHSDFIAEVERALGVLDGAVLVLSAVEGVQAQTRVLMKTLRRLRLPVLLFINKVVRDAVAGAARRHRRDLHGAAARRRHRGAAEVHGDGGGQSGAVDGDGVAAGERPGAGAQRGLEGCADGVEVQRIAAPPGVVTVTGTTPLPEGVVTVTLVASLAVMVASLPPKRTAVAPVRLVPVMTAVCPPADDP
ncbi:Elongation factor G, mitochondrial [Streptomyces antimycoticus]